MAEKITYQTKFVSAAGTPGSYPAFDSLETARIFMKDAPADWLKVWIEKTVTSVVEVR